MPLYDTTADVIRKALRGLDMAPAEAARRSGVPEREVLAASRGPVDGQILRDLAPALGLDGDAFAGLPEYQPPPCPVAAVRQLEMPFDDETVNAWLLENGAGGHLLFDTGVDRHEARRRLDQLGIRSVDILITHSHHDHVAGLSGLRDIAASVAGAEGGEPLHAGAEITRGQLRIRVIALPGHCDGALGYIVEGLELPLCITGDALFAGSMGGCPPGGYQAALGSLREHVMSLPRETVVLPGHGPATNVGSESRGNPFLAAAR